MRVHETNPDYLRSDQLKSGRAEGTEGGSREATQPAGPVAKADRVQISEAGRVLATSDDKRSDLTPERIAQIRQRILEGAYDSLDAVDQVARKILASGDL